MVKTKSNKEKKTVIEQTNAKKTIDFLSVGFFAFSLSMALMLASFVVMFVKGFNLGQDFTGGTSIEITLSKPIELEEIRNELKKNGFNEPIVQHYGSSYDIIIRLPILTNNANIDNQELAIENQKLNSEISTKIATALKQNIDANVIVKRVAFIGPSVGAELAQDGILAICAALVCILIYLGFRFEWRFGTGAVVALAHDVVITGGYLALFQRELDLTIVAAMLSIIGYSLNDTIVVFDRIRENFRKIRRSEPYEVINISLTQTLSRTLMTSATTLVVVVILYIFGGSLLKGFSETLGIGILLGTISSIYVASYMTLKMGIKREHFIVQKIEAEGVEKGRNIR